MKLLAIPGYFVFTAFLFSSCMVNKAADDTSSPNLRMNEVKGRVIRHFRKYFPSIENERWIQDESSNYVANFHINKVSNRVIYDRFGYFICLVKSYGPLDLNEDIKSRVQALYRDSRIIAVTEVSDLEHQAFYIKIQLPHTIKTVYYQDGTLEETESFPYEVAA